MYFAERRDERHRYVDLFKKKQLNSLVDGVRLIRHAFTAYLAHHIISQEARELDALEKKLSYEDIRFYRSIARSQLRKDMASRRKIEEEKKQQAPARGSWSSWLWGSSSSDGTTEAPPEDSAFTGEMTEEQRKQLYEALDYDEKAALAESFNTPRDALKTRVLAQLNRGSLALKRDPHGANTEIISIVSDVFQATFVQRPDNFETSVSLSGFAVYDGTSKDTLYKQIVHVQERGTAGGVVKTQVVEGAGEIREMVDPFFYLRFENNPLDERADSALEVKMRYMEIVYHKGYVEAIYQFFKPPASQIESVEALLVRLFLAPVVRALMPPLIGCRESNARGSPQGDASWAGICVTDSQDRRCPYGPERAHHHHSGRVSSVTLYHRITLTVAVASQRTIASICWSTPVTSPLKASWGTRRLSRRSSRSASSVTRMRITSASSP